VDAAEPAGEQRPDQRAGRERGVEHPGGLRPAAEDLVGERREQRPRHREDHRDEVDDERHEQHLGRAQERQPLEHTAEPARRPPAGGIVGRPETAAMREELSASTAYAAESRARDEHPAISGPTRDADVELDLPQRVRRRQQRNAAPRTKACRLASPSRTSAPAVTNGVQQASSHAAAPGPTTRSSALPRRREQHQPPAVDASAIAPPYSRRRRAAAGRPADEPTAAAEPVRS
jgi:hypothetical protein